MTEPCKHEDVYYGTCCDCEHVLTEAEMEAHMVVIRAEVAAMWADGTIFEKTCPGCGDVHECWNFKEKT